MKKGMIDIKHVLIVDGYARQTLPMVKGFKDIGCMVSVICYSKLDVGYNTRYVDHKFLLACAKEDYAEQENQVIELIKTSSFDLVVPMTDYSAIYLAKNKRELSRFASIAVNDWDKFELAIDKLRTMEICVHKNVAAPVTLFSEASDDNIRESKLNFPVVVKPRTACGSIGFSIIDNLEHLRHVLQEYDNSNGEVFVQEYIPQNGAQYGAEVYRDRNGCFVFTLIDEKPRWFPLDGGSPTINISVHYEQMKTMAEKLLSAMDWHGYANIDFVVDRRDGQPKILEINARISAAVKLDYCCGINVAEVIFNDLFGQPLSTFEYEDGIKTSCFLTEFLWFIKSKKRFQQKPTFLNRRHTTDVVFDWRDPLPSIGFCIQSLKNYRHAMELRKRK